MSDLVGTPVDWFSRIAALIMEEKDSQDPTNF